MGNGAGQCFGICSGALIAPNVVVTARHCTHGSPELIDCEANPSFGAQKNQQFWITTNTQMTGSGAGWHRATGIAVPQDDHICGNDIAVLILQDQIDESEAKAIIPGVQYSMIDDRYLSQFTAIGYGNTGPNGGGSGTRRIRSGIFVACAPEDPQRPCPDFINPAEFVAGDGTCSGDSGSSAFEASSFQAGDPVSFGVLSRGGVSDDGTTCQGSIYTRLDAHRQLVIDAVKSASSNWTLYPEPSWTTYVAPPAKADAGKDAAKPSTKPTAKVGVGEACTENGECTTNVCADVGDGSKVCSKDCTADDTSSCPEGLACRDSLCLPPLADTGTTTTTTTTSGGCSTTSRGSSSGAGFAAVVGLGIGLLLRRSRARRPAKG